MGRHGPCTIQRSNCAPRWPHIKCATPLPPPTLSHTDSCMCMGTYIYIYIYIIYIYGTYIYVYYIYTRSRGAIVLLDGPYCSNISHCLKSVQSFLISACLIHLKQSTGFFHRIRMQGLDILNLAKQEPEVLEHLRILPLLLAILATDPPKSSSLYVQVSLGILLSEVMWRNRWSFGLSLKAKSSAGCK